MKIWIDILTPKQAMFFKPLIEKLEDKNNDLFISSRAFHETIATIKLLKIKFDFFFIKRTNTSSTFNRFKKNF